MPLDVFTEFIPIYEVGAGRVHGFEALARGPKGEHFPKLYASAKRTNDLAELDQQCLRSSLLAASSLARDYRVFVNVLPSTVTQGRVISELEQASLSPQQIVLEIVPFELIEDYPGLAAALEPIEELGCKVALDGFGTGFASLGCLRKLRLHYVKAENDFVDDPDSLSVLKAMGGLTKALALRFVVSGIESQEQLSAALAGGADFVEGYYLSKPSPRFQCAPLTSLASS